MVDNTDLKQYLAKLLALQEIDSEIYDLRSQKEDFPIKLREMDEVLENKKSGMLSSENELKQFQVAKGELEVSLAAGEEKIKKHEGELAMIKTNKEYSVMLGQIESVKADISLIEEKIIGFFDSIEAAQARWAEEKKIFEEEKKKSDEAKSEIKAREVQIDAKLKELTDKRSTVSGGVEEAVLRMYERVLENRGKSALAKIHGEICGGCNMKLRPQIINEAKMQKQLVICENCSRILYTED